MISTHDPKDNKWLTYESSHDSMHKSKYGVKVQGYVHRPRAARNGEESWERDAE